MRVNPEMALAGTSIITEPEVASDHGLTHSLDSNKPLLL
jgi:hypothetical protein